MLLLLRLLKVLLVLQNLIPETVRSKEVIPKPFLCVSIS
jgi:hypothetical protein